MWKIDENCGELMGNACVAYNVYIYMCVCMNVCIYIYLYTHIQYEVKQSMILYMNVFIGILYKIVNIVALRNLHFILAVIYCHCW